MRKRDSKLAGEYHGQKSGELVATLEKDPHNEGATLALLEHLLDIRGRKDRGSNLAAALMMHGHPDRLSRAMKALEFFAQAGCYSVADLEAVAENCPEQYRRKVIDLMCKYCPQGLALRRSLDKLTGVAA